ncbi:MAG: hypothetical protein Q8S84_08610 [bacterium]|nr:hypothetical protein [bacterium]
MKFLVLQKYSSSFSHEISIFSTLHIIAVFLLVTDSNNKSFNLCHLSAFVSLLISSGYIFSAIVHFLTLYLALKTKSNSHSSNAFTVSRNISSVSHEYQTIISVEIEKYGSLVLKYSIIFLKSL